MKQMRDGIIKALIFGICIGIIIHGTRPVIIWIAVFVALAIALPVLRTWLLKMFRA